MKEFSFQTRQLNLSKLQNEIFDLVIIGGGITGAGVARDAALRGLKVALVEANDFASGTSSRSSKLIHGGIRYLENYEFHLVFEALSERTKLFEIAPHLVHPLRFMIPLFRNSRVSPWIMGLGMILYDALALFRSPELHENLSAQKTIQRMPILRENDLVGSFVYSDAYMDDDRLVLETLRSANEASACLVNYTKVIRSLASTDQQYKLEIQDQITKQKMTVTARHVVSTVGPWTDLVGPNLVENWKNILRPTKGIHLTFQKDRLPLTSAVVMAAQKSNRIVFAIPRHEMIIVGTTDTDFQGPPETVAVTKEDVDYLLQITNEYFPGARLTEQDIISSYVGVRPLVKDEAGSEGKTSREHTILDAQPGLTFVAGGKYTTYRLMSEQIVDRVLKNFSIERRALLNRCETSQPLNRWTTIEAYQQAIENAETTTEKLLAYRYGAEATEIIKKSIYQSVWQYEAWQAIHHTMCFNLIDFYVRRVPLFLSYSDHGLSFLSDIVLVFQSELNWSASQADEQVQKLKNYIENELSWRKDFN